jgi:hypothetical protein
MRYSVTVTYGSTAPSGEDRAGELTPGSGILSQPKTEKPRRQFEVTAQGAARMTNRWVQLVASVVATVMIVNLQDAWTSSLEAAQSSAFSASHVDGVANART